MGGPKPENVLVLYNSASSESAEVASYYAAKRPGVRLLGVTGLPAGEQITVDQYRQIVRPQVQAAMDGSVDVIVTTKGMPLRIYNDYNIASFPHTYTDPQNVQHTIYSSSTYKRYSSLESELSRIDRFSTWKQMGDQTWWTGANPSVNPYFYRPASFSHADPNNDGIRLSARLDGYTIADVKASIDRAQNVFLVPFGHQVVLDDSPTGIAKTAMASAANNVLAPRNQNFIYDNNTAPVLTSAAPVIGYVSHGTNDGSGQLNPDYMQSQLQFNIANGAVAQTWESYNGYSFNEAGHQGQGLIADWIRAGGTGGIAHVQEPGGSLTSVTNEDRLFQMLLSGYTWVESAWNATPQVSFVNTVIGDPLMTWRPWTPGDANLDGIVNQLDYDVLQANWMQPGTFADGDFDGNGMVDEADYEILQVNIPEPCAASLLCGAMLMLVRRNTRR